MATLSLVKNHNVNICVWNIQNKSKLMLFENLQTL